MFIESDMSSFFTVFSGVPQGSVWPIVISVVHQ